MVDCSRADCHLLYENFLIFLSEKEANSHCSSYGDPHVRPLWAIEVHSCHICYNAHNCDGCEWGMYILHSIRDDSSDSVVLYQWTIAGRALEDSSLSYIATKPACISSLNHQEYVSRPVRWPCLI